MPKPRARPSAPPPSQRRNTRARLELLTELSGAIALAWANSCREALHKEGRAASGGFPGTLTEARTRFLQRIGPELERRSLAPASYEEQEREARAIFRRARSEWLAWREDDLPD